MDWMKRKSVPHMDLIITVLGATRICSQFATSVFIFCGVFYFNPKSLLLLYVITRFHSFFNHSSSWLMTLLCVVFCLKISNFHHVFLLRLKMIVSKQVVHLIVASALIAFCNILLLCWFDHIEFPKYMVNNVTADGTGIPQRSIILLVTYLLCNFVPFLLYCTSSVLVIASLCFHVNRMKLNQTATVNLDAYYNVIKFMMLSMAYYILNATSCAAVIYSHQFCSLDIIWVYITLDIFPIFNSIYLILRTNKLRDHFLKIFQHGINCLRNRYTEDPVQTIMK
ncbi:hypothetical protein GDO81_021775 [Engystomops pustulosus]|uniref:Taste receptor type 2 n=1 Tax=Engystomops pustulosus TaxID=76066 RepID=A0AAV6ZBR3_ENGPU|nr:hypothetical protein GDO81_021775 [Engystomops pustulosus]